MSKLQFTCPQEHFEKGYFFRNFQTCFRTLIDNRPDLWQKISAALPKLHSTCPKNFSIFFAKFCHVSFNFVFERKKILVLKKVSSNLSKLHSKRPRTFWGIFFSKSFFFNLVWNLSKDFSSFVEIFQQNCQKWILRVQRITSRKTLSWLCETISDFGKGNVGFAAENLQPCYQICTFVSRWAIGKIVLKEFLLFLIVFGRPKTFFGFSVVSFKAWWSKLNSTSQEEHIQ